MLRLSFVEAYTTVRLFLRAAAAGGGGGGGGGGRALAPAALVLLCLAAGEDEAATALDCIVALKKSGSFLELALAASSGYREHNTTPLFKQSTQCSACSSVS